MHLHQPQAEGAVPVFQGSRFRNNCYGRCLKSADVHNSNIGTIQASTADIRTGIADEYVRLYAPAWIIII